MGYPLLLSLLSMTFVVVTASSLEASPDPQDAGWSVGRSVPDLRLPTIDGTRTIALSELRGTKLLLIQFASW